MVSYVNTIAFIGIETVGVEVQVHIVPGARAIPIVGLPDKTVDESKERLSSALHSMGLSMPLGRITVNLTPADLHKAGSHYDLAIALAILTEMDILPKEHMKRCCAIGEIALDGSLIATNGILSAAIHASANQKTLICPKSNGPEAKWASDKLEIVAADNLLEIINHFKGRQQIKEPELPHHKEQIHYPDLKDVKGQLFAKRALEIVASGGHNLLMVGPPGSGKSMLASRLPGILPELDPESILEVNRIASVSGNLKDGKLVRQRPFRDPHHSCSMPSMVGGGKLVKPGEITLAHRGVLFLDELPEFPRNVLDSLRQPLETGRVSISRVHSHITYPSKFQLIAAMNPCRCGYFGDPERSCSKVPNCAKDYQSKISGPMMDRIDVHVEVAALTPRDLDQCGDGETSEQIGQRVLAAREIQKKRYQHLPISLNSEADGTLLQDVAALDDAGKKLINQALDKMRLSMRSYNRILRVARTIADMTGSERVHTTHISEALHYRMVQVR